MESSRKIVELQQNVKRNLAQAEFNVNWWKLSRNFCVFELNLN